VQGYAIALASALHTPSDEQHNLDSIAVCRSVAPTRRGDRCNKKSHMGGYESERGPVSAGINLM